MSDTHDREDLIRRADYYGMESLTDGEQAFLNKPTMTLLDRAKAAVENAISHYRYHDPLIWVDYDDLSHYEDKNIICEARFNGYYRVLGQPVNGNCLILAEGKVTNSPT